MSQDLSLIKNISHTEVGPVGVNGVPFIDMEPFLETSCFSELHNECVVGLSCVDKFDLSFVPGEIPPELRSQYGGMYLESEILSNLDKHDPEGIHRKNIQNMTVQQRRRYCYLALGALSPWYGVCYLKSNDFKTKNQANVDQAWSIHAQYFPKLTKYLESLKENVFEDIGRVLFFISYPLNPVVIHRDYVPVKHQDHCINFYFSKGRPAFIYDEIKKEKIYLNPKCRAYFFNNRDYHGLDAEPQMRYTLRVDGTFKKEISEKLGLKDGWVS